eukprot:1156295-Pelagomonas_calceolata.AAC.3
MKDPVARSKASIAKEEVSMLARFNKYNFYYIRKEGQGAMLQEASVMERKDNSFEEGKSSLAAHLAAICGVAQDLAATRSEALDLAASCRSVSVARPWAWLQSAVRHWTATPPKKAKDSSPGATSKACTNKPHLAGPAHMRNPSYTQQRGWQATNNVLSSAAPAFRQTHIPSEQARENCQLAGFT